MSEYMAKAVSAADIKNGAATITNGQVTDRYFTGTRYDKYDDRFDNLSFYVGGGSSGSSTLTDVAVTEDYVVATGIDIVLCDCTSNNITVTLPAAADSDGRVIYVKKTDAAATYYVTIDGSGAETIDGAAITILATGGDCVALYCNGISWSII